MTGKDDSSIKRAVRWTGSGLSVIAVVFVIARLTTYTAEMNLSVVTSALLPVLLLCVAYGLANIFLAFAWKNILAHFDLFPATGLAIGIYAESQLAKYLPGNIFQFVSRQALGTGTGMPAMVVAKSAVWELALLALTGSLAVPLLAPRFAAIIGPGLSFGLFALGAAGLAWGLARWFSGRLTRCHHTAKITWV